MDMLPDNFFIFLNQARAEAYLTYKHTRTFTSRFHSFLGTEEGRRALDRSEVDPFPFVPNASMYPFLSPFTVSAMNEYRIEWDIEQARRRNFPLKPSRLSAIFAFGDEQTCVEVNRKYGWPLETVRSFTLTNDSKGNARVAKVNMEVVSLMRHAYPLASWDEVSLNDVWWAHYWGGGDNLSVEVPHLHQGQAWRRIDSGIIWEWLIEGQVVSESDEPVFR